MNEFKKCKIVMLDAKNSTGLAFNFETNELFIPVFDSLNHKECTYKHLYILSYDEIKEGDYFYIPDDTAVSQIEKAKYFEHNLVNGWVKKACFKIIASTDIFPDVLYLNENFIKQYVEANGFDEILVEYENKIEELEDNVDNLLECCNEDFEEHIEESPYYHLYYEALKELKNYEYKPTFCVDFYNRKLPIIKIIKSSFNKEELPIQAIKDCLKYCENQQIYDKLSKYGDFYYKLNQFIKENDL